jgi:hypothetical protein
MMAVLYRIHFFDHAGDIYRTVRAMYDSDAEAIAEAHSRNASPHTAATSFEVWQDDRLVHQHPKLADRVHDDGR